MLPRLEAFGRTACGQDHFGAATQNRTMQHSPYCEDMRWFMDSDAIAREPVLLESTVVASKESQ